MGRQFVYDDIPSHSSQKGNDRAPSPVACKSRPRSIMIIVQACSDVFTLVPFSPAHYLYARHFNGLVCVVTTTDLVVRGLPELQATVIRVAEYLINEEYSTPDQVSMFLYLSPLFLCLLVYKFRKHDVFSDSLPSPENRSHYNQLILYHSWGYMGQVLEPQLLQHA